jgi:hypothetical protein
MLSINLNIAYPSVKKVVDLIVRIYFAEVFLLILKFTGFFFVS